MLLLVSVSDGGDAAAALEGGADFIDAKDPRQGALGAVPIAEFEAIHRAVSARRPVTAALGDAVDPRRLELDARAYAAAGADLIKIGFDAVRELAALAALIRAAVLGAREANPSTGIVVAKYADAGGDGHDLVRVGADAGARGLLLDTWNKNGAGLRHVVSRRTIESAIGDAHARGLFAALAGKLTAEDIEWAADLGADVIGFRGAACTGGRTGRVVAEKVADLKERCGARAPSPSGRDHLLAR